jgi:ABC-2 type transport system permease protein
LKSLYIALKTLKEALRDPQLLILFLIFPALLVNLYFMAYGSGSKSLSNTLILLVDNQDQGTMGAGLIARLRSEKFDGAPMLTVTEISNIAEARITLNEWKAGALLTIPADFTSTLKSADPTKPPRLRLLKDPFSDSATFLSVMFEEPLRAFIEEETGWKQPRQVVTYDFVKGTGNLNDFQFGVPGVIVFGIIFGVMYTAILLVREMIGGAFQRLRMANISGLSLLAGITLAQLVVCIVQVAVTVLVAYICGLQTVGSYLLLGIFSLGISLTATGCGMITACFSKNDGEAANLSMLFILPLVFFSGAMYPMPPLPLFTIAGKTLFFADILPTTYATDAIRRIMIFGEGMSTLWPSLFWVVVQSLILFLFGIRLFQHFRLNRSF